MGQEGNGEVLWTDRDIGVSVVQNRACKIVQLTLNLDQSPLQLKNPID